LHPLVHAPASVATFRLFNRDGVVALAGELDSFSAPALDRSLGRVPTERSLVVALDDVEFVDHRALAVIAQHTAVRRSRGGSLVVAGASPTVRQVATDAGVDLAFV
jgi:anti-anti-sigma factor